ncbi:MAG: hypothetical protein AB7P76_05900 [Candidatus Melainabacteria bacterium]
MQTSFTHHVPATFGAHRPGRPGRVLATAAVAAGLAGCSSGGVDLPPHSTGYTTTIPASTLPSSSTTVGNGPTTTFNSTSLPSSTTRGPSSTTTSTQLASTTTTLPGGMSSASTTRPTTSTSSGSTSPGTSNTRRPATSTTTDPGADGYDHTRTVSDGAIRFEYDNPATDCVAVGNTGYLFPAGKLTASDSNEELALLYNVALLQAPMAGDTEYTIVQESRALEDAFQPDSKIIGRIAGDGGDVILRDCKSIKQS